MFPVPPQVRRKRTPVPRAPGRPVPNYLPPAFARSNRAARARASKRTVGPRRSRPPLRANGARWPRPRRRRQELQGVRAGPW
jgi:hypothetical protein